MKILVINAGSSSLKYQLFNMDNQTVMAKGLCERIGLDGQIKHEAEGKDTYKAQADLPDHSAAIKKVIELLTSKESGVIASMDEISAVGHRFVHGGEYFLNSCIVDEEMLKVGDQCIELAPLHNPPNLTGIRACDEIMAGTPQVAVFDTAFHSTMPGCAYMYPIPYKYYTQYKIRKYGFHGTSHKYVASRAASMLGKPIEQLKIVTCHLGNGSSITAVKGGQSVDTTMGFTPLDGVIMGTRSGTIDPAIVTFIMEKEGLDTKTMGDMLNKKSGALGVSEISSDFRDIENAAKEGNKQAALTVEMLCYQVKKYIGSYAAAMGGIDAIVFTAGIGENNGSFRAQMVDGLEFLGVSIDEEKNKIRGREIDISTDDAKVRVLVIPTNEELMIAMDTARLISEKKA